MSEVPTVGTDQTVETFWGKIFTSFIYLSATEADNGTFYKWSGKSMRDRFVRTIQPMMNVINLHFCSVKNRKISGVGENNELYEIAMAEYEKAEGKPFPFLQCAKCLHEMPRFDQMIKPDTLVLVDKTVISKGEASNMAAPMGLSLKQPVGMIAAKKHVDNNLKNYVWMKDSEESMPKWLPLIKNGSNYGLQTNFYQEAIKNS